MPLHSGTQHSLIGVCVQQNTFRGLTSSQDASRQSLGPHRSVSPVQIQLHYTAGVAIMHAAVQQDERQGPQDAELRQTESEMFRGRPEPSLSPVSAASLASRLQAGAACQLMLCDVQKSAGKLARNL